MFNLNSLKNILVPLYLFIYLIFPYSAITQTAKNNFKRSLENALNSRNLKFIKQSFTNEENLKITKKFSKILKEFPDSKWKIKKLKSNNPNEEMYEIKVLGKKLVQGEIYILESKFNYSFSLVNEKINQGTIKNLFTIKNSKKTGTTPRV